MNVLELMSKELKMKSWTTEEKARYIFLRSCELFTYDNRYLYGDYELQQKIRNRKINLEWVENFEVICSSHMIEVIVTLFQELLNLSCIISNSNHTYFKFFLGTKEIYVDSTSSYDLERVKMNLTTKKFFPNEYKNSMKYNQKLKKIDQKIGYIHSNYEDDYLKKQANWIQKYENDSKNDIDFLQFKMRMVLEQIKRYPKLLGISDYDHCLYQLMKGLQIPYKKQEFYLDMDENHWNFITVYKIEALQHQFYYILEQEDGRCQFFKSNEEEVQFYARSLKYANESDFTK